MGIVYIQHMESLQAGEESAPLPSKLSPHFNPQSLDASVMGRSIIKQLVMFYLGHKVDSTYVPQMNDALFGPRNKTIVIATSLFSPPLSPRTCEGRP